MKSFTFCILLAHVLAFPLFAQKNAAAVTLNLAKAVTQSPKTVLMSELASDVRYFPLETTDNFPLLFSCNSNDFSYTSAIFFLQLLLFLSSNIIFLFFK